MRQIKFRAWNKFDEKMEDWEYLTGYCDLHYLFCEPVFESHDVIPMQYTGLKDKNGVEIYEDDLVPYMDDFLQVIIEADGVWFENDEVTLRYDDFKGDGLEIEVIGNIHQNPELLTGRISK